MKKNEGKMGHFRISFEERQKIQDLLFKRKTIKYIADKLKRSPPAINKEIKLFKDMHKNKFYDAAIAQREYYKRVDQMVEKKRQTNEEKINNKKLQKEKNPPKTLIKASLDFINRDGKYYVDCEQLINILDQGTLNEGFTKTK